jgi:hypothetical protein
MLSGPLDVLVHHHPWWWTLGPAFAVAAGTGYGAQTRWIGPKLVTAATPKSPIIAWEKAGTEKRMKEILAAWGSEGRRWARRSLDWDVVFLASYGALLSVACSMAAIFFDTHHAPWGRWIFAAGAWLALVAAFLDLIEDAYLLRLLRPFDGEELPRRMLRVSTAKWALVYALVPLSLAALLIDLVRR